jgi:hypothetical protein
MTDRARNLIVMEIMKLGQDPDELLEQSIRKGWQDVFPLKEQSREPLGYDTVGRPLHAEPVKSKHLCRVDGCMKIGVIGRGDIMYCHKHDIEMRDKV